MADEDWERVEAVSEIADEHMLDRLDLLTEVTHELRGLLLRNLRHPKTVAEMAEELDVPVTRLYHHINRLEEAGLIVVDATRRSGAATERRYRAVAKAFKLDPALLESTEGPDMAKALGAIFDVAKVELAKGLELDGFKAAFDNEQLMLSLSELRLTPDRQQELVAKMVALLDDFNDEEGEPYRLVMAGFIGAN